jgi:hypothetical protein
MTDEQKLMELCRKFIRDNGISCPETIYQMDRVIEGAYGFIEEICDIAGYDKAEDGDEDEV